MSSSDRVILDPVTGTDNPFLSRRPVTDVQRYVTPGSDLSVIYQLIRSGTGCSVVGYPRIGKTSLLNYLANKDGGRKAVCQSAEPCLVVYLDAEPFGIPVDLNEPVGERKAPDQEDREQRNRAGLGVLQMLMERLDDAVRAEFDSPPDRLGELREKAQQAESWEKTMTHALFPYLKELREAYKEPMVVLLIDGADGIIGNGVSSILRQWIGPSNPIRGNIIIATTRSLSELEPNWLSPGSVLSTSCEKIQLKFFSKEASRQFLRDRTKDEPFSADEEKELFEISGGHPDLLRTAARYLYDERHREPRRGPGDFREAVHASLRPNCQLLYSSLSESEREAVDRLARDEAAAPPSLSALIGTGLIVKREEPRPQSSSPYRCSSSAFENWLLQRDADKRRVGSGSDQAGTSGVLTFDGFSRVTFLGSELELSKRKYRLLHYLAERKEKGGSRVEISQAVWGNKDSGSRLDMAIKRLRDDLRRTFGDTIRIDNARGEGFRLVIR